MLKKQKFVISIVFIFFSISYNLNGTNHILPIEQTQTHQNDTVALDSIIRLINQTSTKNDSLTKVIVLFSDSIADFKQLIESGNLFSKALLEKADSLNQALNLWKAVADSISIKHSELLEFNTDLRNKVALLQKNILEQKELIDIQLAQLHEKDSIIKHKEELYKEAIFGSKIDLITLEGKLSAKEQETSGKVREIDLLMQNIQEKQREIEQKNQEISKLTTRRENSERIIDSLRDTLSLAQQSFIKANHQRNNAKLEIADLKARLAAKDKRDKQVAVVQGVAMRSYRSPLYMLAPKDVNNFDSYEITNENAGGVEFDLVTGATVRLFKISKEQARYNTDFGWFVGFGGKNLFKNFYFGPNLKIFDFIHINAGLNVAEFRVLKKGFTEGDVLPLGVAIPTVNQWKFNAYFTLSFDFELITQVAGKLK